MFNDKSILITGGTGSFGHAFVSLTLAKYNPRRLVIFSRDGMKQWEMACKVSEGFPSDSDTHTEWTDIKTLQQRIAPHRAKIGAI
jgi:FlaA1/EpsC-like NDP-sugar epimerase